ncbi:CreA family protein [Paraburkholderia rhizosphaerae]|uniref:CreA protein n=1 Tax=Paraburkholderia rhizosphaerae TaxID=480658 RepID=A0A4V3HF10_9BURK|nr:CreA family protein [Paraburkholderia rhizosphaerae]TDY50991.1 CreA protein [Paraburkholderia rhizosphaerae]
MTRCLVLLCCTATVLATSVPVTVRGEEFARITTHSHRYGGQVGISAFDDPLLTGVTCYVSTTHDDNRFGGNAQPVHAPDTEVSCHQVGTLDLSKRIPRQAQVFDESVNPIFKELHVFRILDPIRHTVLYFSYTESELAGDMPGHVDVIRLNVREKRSDK